MRKIVVPLQIVLLLLLMNMQPVFSQQVAFTKVNSGQNSFGGLLTGITQDAQGYMWFGGNGLYKYDGYKIITFKHDPLNVNSLASNRIECINSDESGLLWIGILGAGLDRFDPATFTFTHYKHRSNDNNSLSNDSVTAILKDHEGILWVGTMGGLNRFNPVTGTFTHYSHNANDPTSISNNQVRVLYEDRQNNIWVGCGSSFLFENTKKEGGLNRFDKRTGRFTRYMHNPKDEHSLIDNRVRAILEDSHGTFWVGTAGDGLHTMDRATGTFQRHLYNPVHPQGLSRPPLKKTSGTVDDHITFIKEDITRAIWIGTFGSGLNRYDPKTQLTTHYEANKDSAAGFTGNSPWYYYTSRDGMIWISTWEPNLYSVDPLSTIIPHFELVGGCTAFCEGKGLFWIGTTRGLIRNDRSQGVIKRFTKDPKNSSSIGSDIISVLYRDFKGSIWVGTTGGGLNLYNTSTQSFTRYQHKADNSRSLMDDDVRVIREDSKKNLWIGNRYGLDLMDRTTGEFTHYKHNDKDTNSISGGWVISIAEDSKKNLWVGTQRGLNKLDGSKFKHYLNEIRIYDIYEDRKGTLWVGTDVGLYQYNLDTDQFSHFNLGTGIELNDIGTITEDGQQNLWFGTSNGITKLNAQRDQISAYGNSVGVNANDLSRLSTYIGTDGKIYVGDALGYYSFSPDQIKTNLQPPQIGLTNFRISNELVRPSKDGPLKQPLSLVKEIRLAYNQHTFSLEITALHYSNPQGNRLLYMLQNYDDTWRLLGNGQTAFYFNIPPGKYVFKIQATNSNGISAEKTFNIIITPPWWRTWWAYTIYGLLLIALVISIHRYQKRRLLQAERERTRVREMAQAKEIEKAYHELKVTQTQLIQSEKMASLGELTAGIAHEIQNPLNFVNNFSEVNKELIGEMKTEIANGNYEEVKTIADDIELNEEKINHHGKRADAIVKGMLQHSRASSGKKEPTDINALCDEYLRLSYHGLRAKDKSFNATIKTDFDTSIGYINIIPQDIGRVILNLLTNAFYAVNEKSSFAKASADKVYEPTVMVSTQKTGNKVLIKVKDNGKGIPQKVMDKIFQPFFTTKPTGQGTGLGLSLSYDIVKAHGGELKVETKEARPADPVGRGEGSLFIITLPA